MLEQQRILPAISDHRSLEYFIKMDKPYGVLMNFRLTELQAICKLLAGTDKKWIIHTDLIRGLANNADGAEHLIRDFGADGLISTHPSVISQAKKRNIIAIQRIFMIDSHSLRKSIELAQKTKPDYIEVLPGFSYLYVDQLKAMTKIPLIGGGLIDHEELLRACLNSGLAAVTTSTKKLWSLEV